MSRKPNPIENVPGQDSFLDVVCNFVGILIILVVLMGMRLKDEADAAKVEARRALQKPPTASISADSASAPKRAADAVEADIHRIDAEMKTLQGNAEVRFLERNRLQTVTAAVEHGMADRRAQLDAAARSEFDQSQSLSAAKQELDALLRNRATVEAASGTPTVLEHRPTPLAKTVFGREEHFQLAHGRVAYVPLNEMVEQLKAEVPQKLWKLRETAEITETIGPFQDFRLRYTLKRTEYQVETKAGPIARQGVELDTFVMLPTTDQLGETLADALAPNSLFHARIDRMNKEATTLTVWVYPDSYGDFRTLKKALFDAGFIVAGRPLPEGQPIGGSPKGTRSAAL